MYHGISNERPLATGKRVKDMSTSQLEISQVLGELNKLAPAGYALGFHIQYTTPKFMFQTYKKEWLEYYSQNGLLMSDPMVAWGFEQAGACRWSGLQDPAGVLVKAAEYGMRFGIVCASDSDGSRSIGGFSREDREFTDLEISTITAAVDDLHANTADQAQLSDETIEQLKKMSVMVTHPGS